MQTIDESMKSGVEKMNWIIFFSPAKAELFIVVLLLPRNQLHFLPAYVFRQLQTDSGSPGIRTRASGI